jgi:dethiobiotin synthetase
MSKAFFITGTGTEIGKTFVTCEFIRQLKQSGKDVMAIKPVISGWEDNSPHNDTMQILNALGLPDLSIDKISPWRFEAPLAPSMAARIAGKEIDYTALVQFCKNSVKSHEYLLCEGAGGVIVPITSKKTTLDLICDTGFAAILIAGTYLGAISHALTAIKSLENSGVEIHKIIVNESVGGVAIEETIAELRNFTNNTINHLRRNSIISPLVGL